MLRSEPSFGETESKAHNDAVPLAQGNLKQTVVLDSSESLPPAVDLTGESLHQIQEYQALQRLFQTTDSPAALLLRPQLFLSFLPVCSRTLRPNHVTVELKSDPGSDHASCSVKQQIDSAKY